MAKSQTQRTKEHIARLRRKAQAYDELTDKLNSFLAVASNPLLFHGQLNVAPAVQYILEQSKQSVQEAGE